MSRLPWILIALVVVGLIWQRAQIANAQVRIQSVEVTNEARASEIAALEEALDAARSARFEALSQARPSPDLEANDDLESAADQKVANAHAELARFVLENEISTEDGEMLDALLVDFVDYRFEIWRDFTDGGRSEAEARAEIRRHRDDLVLDANALIGPEATAALRRTLRPYLRDDDDDAEGTH